MEGARVVKDFSDRYPFRKFETFWYVDTLSRVQGFVTPEKEYFWVPEVGVSAMVGKHLFSDFNEAQRVRIENLRQQQREIQNALAVAESAGPA
jgi:hypothetical protein